jgi:hypothetical protein
MDEQRFVAHLVQQQQAIGLEKGLGVTQGTADISGGVQDVGGNDQVIPAGA